MSNLSALLRHNKHVEEMEKRCPRLIQIYFDGHEVLTFEDGHKVLEKLLPDTYEPYIIEMLWDRKIVYVLQAENNIE